MNDGMAERGFAQRLGDLTLNHFASEVVERISRSNHPGWLAAWRLNAAQKSPPPLPSTTIERAAGSISDARVAA